MQVDFDIVMAILKRIEDHPSSAVLQCEFADLTEEYKDYLALLENNQLVWQAEANIYASLTMRGHDFLDLASTPEVWQFAKSKVGKVDRLSLNMFYRIMESKVESMLGLNETPGATRVL